MLWSYSPIFIEREVSGCTYARDVDTKAFNVTRHQAAVIEVLVNCSSPHSVAKFQSPNWGLWNPFETPLAKLLSVVVDKNLIKGGLILEFEVPGSVCLPHVWTAVRARPAIQLIGYWINSLMYWIDSLMHCIHPNSNLNPNPDSDFNPNTDPNHNPNYNPNPNLNPTLQLWIQLIKLLIQSTNLSIQCSTERFDDYIQYSTKRYSCILRKMDAKEENSSLILD